MFKDKLFRFRQFSQNSIAELNNRTLWFSSAKDFNDPFEFMHQIDLTLPEDDDAIKNWLISSVQSEKELTYIESLDNVRRRELAQREVDNLVNGHVKTISCTSTTKICCLTKEYRDPLMWSHYTNGMTGFVIVYNPFDTIDGKTFPALPVRYVKEPPIIDADCLNLASNADGFELNTRLIATKHERWAYEQEFRFICCPEHPNEFLQRVKLRNGGIMDLPDYAIHGVICGYKMRPDDYKVVQSICKHNKYKMYKAEIHSDRYEVIVSEIVS
jgi:hypothetical protein